MATLGKYIRALRDQQDLSLREFAKKLECSPAFISDVELGRRYPSEEVLRNMARLLRTTTKDLLDHDVRPPVEQMKRAAALDPRYALAFRTVIENKVSAQDLLELANKKGKQSRPRDK